MKWYLALTINGITETLDEEFSSANEVKDAGNIYMKQGDIESFEYFNEDIKKFREKKGTI